MAYIHTVKDLKDTQLKQILKKCFKFFLKVEKKMKKN